MPGDSSKLAKTYIKKVSLKDKYMLAQLWFKY